MHVVVLAAVSDGEPTAPALTPNGDAGGDGQVACVRVNALRFCEAERHPATRELIGTARELTSSAGDLAHAGVRRRRLLLRGI